MSLTSNEQAQLDRIEAMLHELLIKHGLRNAPPYRQDKLPPEVEFANRVADDIVMKHTGIKT